MKINEIGMIPGTNRKTKRRGRGSGSGHGKTSCRGHKGAHSRSGVTTRPGFEGGQMQLIRRLPKRGFNSRAKVIFQVVNIESLNGFTKGSVVGPKELKEAGLISSTKSPVKILGDGELTKELTVKASACSKSASEKIKAAGATLELLKSQGQQADNHKPVTGSVKPKPATGGIKPKPETGGINPKPTTGSNKPKPQTDNHKPTS